MCMGKTRSSHWFVAAFHLESQIITINGEALLDLVTHLAIDDARIYNLCA